MKLPYANRERPEETFDLGAFGIVLLCIAFLFGMAYFLILATLADEVSAWNTTWPCGVGFNPEDHHPVADMVANVLSGWFALVPIAICATNYLFRRDEHAPSKLDN
jgi:hypothetical protein